MPEQPRHLVNKYEDIVNLQGRGMLWRHPAQLVYLSLIHAALDFSKVTLSNVMRQSKLAK